MFDNDELEKEIDQAWDKMNSLYQIDMVRYRTEEIIKDYEFELPHLQQRVKDLLKEVKIESDFLHLFSSANLLWYASQKFHRSDEESIPILDDFLRLFEISTQCNKARHDGVYDRAEHQNNIAIDHDCSTCDLAGGECSTSCYWDEIGDKNGN